ncbi:hypothetical protein H206_06260 [Candidatus Electrothrix aarhusensis]|uniref:Uncharacterized protein n=1 Tax=Candidatus Electrothrix aarhusensis TaxID=1859131 RepID=A0A3S3SQ62_9BACT|nr:hypothetical protein H206_06260 [Candidatus Electrothrix aarhusensis]
MSFPLTPCMWILCSRLRSPVGWDEPTESQPHSCLYLCVGTPCRTPDRNPPAD